MPENIGRPPLPPKAPELHPIETIWQMLLRSYLANQTSEPSPRSLMPVGSGKPSDR